MKKIVCLVLALLCVSVMAVAESTPSKTTADLTLIQTSAANLPEGASFTLAPVTTARAADLPDYEERVAVCEAEIAKLAQKYHSPLFVHNSETAREVRECKERYGKTPTKLAQSASVAEYFGTVTDSEGNEINLTEILGADALNVYEFLPLVVDGYDPAYGNVTATMEFSTPYEEGEQVVVLVGLVTVAEDGTEAMAWTALPGLGTSNGGIEVEFTPEIMVQIQEGTAMMTVVSAN